MLVLFLLSVCVALTVSQTDDYEVPTVWNINKYPNPMRDYVKCGREQQSSICDPNGIIPKNRADEIDMLIRQLKAETRCKCYECVQNKRGFVIRVALMKQMERIRQEENNEENRLKDAKLYAYLLTQKWKFTGSCNETILILYSQDDHIVYTLTRENARLYLKDENIVKVAVNTRHYFDDEETIADGLKAMILGYKSFLNNEDYKPLFLEPVNADNNSGTRLANHIFLNLLLFIYHIFK